MDKFEFDSEEARIESIRHMVTHPAWRGYFVPSMQDALQNCLDILCVPREQRGADISDADLRARISVLKDLINKGPEAVIEWDTITRQNESELEYQHNLQERADVGHIGPLHDQGLTAS